ncbi:MAG: adenylate/guanylate cyclase domain-containing protein [Actinomycetota bacterium]
MTDRVCSSCAADLPAGAKFCPSCGAVITARADERRIVTVLFADVVGFTPMSEDLDPEQVKRMLDRCFEGLAADVLAHGGRVDKIVGDEIMAVFGAPVAHEDDPERAVRAGLQMQRTLGEHTEETGSKVRMRIGINTGEVVVGGLRGGADVTALGDVVNIAKRLQTSAEPGDVLVGAATYASTSEVIAYDDLESLSVKGRGAPVDAWRALEALGPPGFRPGRMRTPLFGRKAELGMLWQALGTAVSQRNPHLVLLVGEAGVGKTRLVEEAVEMARVQHDALVIEGRCLPYGEANPWWPVAEALRQACGIDPADPADVAAGKCREAIATVMGATGEGVEAARVSDGLLYLMGYEASLNELEPSRARDEAVRSIQHSLAANARQGPLVIVLSEIHWADKLVLDLIDTMFERLRDLPILLMATARSELYDRWTPRLGCFDLHVVNLQPLDENASAEIVQTLLGQNASPQLVDLIVDRASGNPLFLEELVAILGETDMGASGLDGTELPATLRGLVAARLDALDRLERSVLEDAAVVGRRGQIDALVALGDTRGESDGRTWLTSLQQKDLLVLEDGEFEFKSDLVRDVAYETLTKSERGRRHAAVADWLAEYAHRTEREEEHLERIAHHFAQAAQLVREIGIIEGVPTDVSERGLEWLERAADRAEARETTGVSLHLLDHALNLIGDDQPARRAAFLVKRARGRSASRDMSGAYADIESVLEIAREVDDATLVAQALTVRGETEQREGDHDRSVATLIEAVECWRKAGNRRGEAEALRLSGFTRIQQGRLDEAESVVSEALQISRELDDRRGEAWGLQNLAWVSFSRGDYDLAEERLRVAADLFDEIGDFGGQGWAFGLLGYVWYFKGRLNEAATIAEQGVEWTREIGDRWAHGMMLNLLAGIRLWQGRTRESLQQSSEALQLFKEIDDEMGLSLSTLQKAWALLFTGSSEDALRLAEGLKVEEGPRAPAPLAGVMGVATIKTFMGDGAGALAILDEYGIDAEIGDADMIVGRALAELIAGRPHDAYATATMAWSLDPKDPGARTNTACIYALCAAAAGRPDEAISLGEEVGRIGGSYVDQFRAHVARALGHTQRNEDIETRAALGSAKRIADASEDVVSHGLIRLAEAVIGELRRWEGSPDLAGARHQLMAVGIDAEPWEQVFRVAAGSGA